MFKRINSLAVREATTREPANRNRPLASVLHRIKRSTRATRNFAAVALSVFTLPVVAAVTPGAIPGSFSVSESGAATYTIPIAVPPGTAGIEPKLSLAYNSQGGNGLLGMGWSLGGLSVIHRCPKTVAQDGVLQGVNYNANDRFCLDGQRLVAISGAYGGNGTEYRTETESFSRIVSYGSQGSGPAYWKVWTKSGQIIEYGNTDDSRIEAQGKTEVMVWTLNKLADTVGNYLTVTYTEDNANGQYYPDRIDSTGNAATGKSPINSVRFFYESRPDITHAYHAGSLSNSTVRLQRVQTYAGDATLVRDYKLAYEQSISTQRSRLTGITECVTDEACLPSAIFGWQEVENGFGGTQTHPEFLPNEWFNSSYPGRVMAMDANGDGKTDLVAMGTGVTHIALSNGNGFEPKIQSGQTLWNEWFLASYPGRVMAGDFNGDGKQDVVGVGTGVTYLALSTGSGFRLKQLPECVSNSWFNSVYPGRVRVMDVDGDGKLEIVATGTGVTYICQSKSGPQDLLDSLTTGLGATTTITYTPLTAPTVYTKDTTAVYPYVDVQAPLYVVSSVATSDGIGGSYITDYTYAGAKSHQLGGGFLGFRQTTVSDRQTGIRSTTTYRQDFPYHGAPLRSERRTGNNTLLGQSTTSYTDKLLNTGISPVWRQSLPSRTIESSYELNGSLIGTVITDSVFDAYGNPTSIVVNSGGGYSKTTTNTYDNIIDANRWFLGRLRRSTVTSVTP